MVDHEKQRARYISHAEGAPPVPPPGGYRGARRGPQVQSLPFARTSAVAVAEEPEKRKPNVLGWIALVGGGVFALILLVSFLLGATDAIYGATMLTAQLLVVGVVVAALATRRGRTLGAIALSATLVLNIGTVGALGAVQTSASGNYDGAKSEEQKHEEAYPGIKDTPTAETLSKESLEEVRTSAELALEDMKSRLTAEFGYTWVVAAEEDLRPERNGYGGESMLVEYTSIVWATNEPIQDYARKLAVMEIIDEVLYDHDLLGIIALNEPGTSGITDDSLEMLYGSADPRTQDTWEWYSNDYPGPRSFYATINDTSKDESGEFLKSRQAQADRTGEPLEGLRIRFFAREMLSEADREEFETLLEDYPGF